MNKRTRRNARRAQRQARNKERDMTVWYDDDEDLPAWPRTSGFQRERPKDLIVPKITFNGRESTLDLFLKLTSYTCPQGYESEMYGDSLKALGWTKDEDNNYYFVCDPNGITPLTIFTAHMDTVGWSVPIRVIQLTKNGMVNTDGSTVLGADDKAGMTILLRMAHVFKVPGIYALFVGEESGCIGSRSAAEKKIWAPFKRMISFDRRGYWDIITHQMSERCCSEAFAEALAEEINGIAKNIIRDLTFKYRPSNGGLFTDSASFIKQIAECTNISVGYDGAHGNTERQDVLFLDDLIEILALVQWEELPTERDPSKVDRLYSTYSSYGTHGGYSYGSTAYTQPSKDRYLNMGQPKKTWYEPEGEWKKLDDLAAMKSFTFENVQDWVLRNPEFASALIMQMMEDWPDIVSYTYNILMEAAQEEIDADQKIADAWSEALEKDEDPVGSDAPPAEARVQNAITLVRSNGHAITTGDKLGEKEV